MSDNQNQDQTFLGTGWSFPPAFNKRKKSVEMLSGEEDIRSSLRILVSTRLGERFLRGRYGSRVADMIFEPLDSSQRELMEVYLKDAIFLHEPRVVPLKVQFEISDLEGRVDVTVEYRIVATNTRRNFVYPFYRLEGTEIPS